MNKFTIRRELIFGTIFAISPIKLLAQNNGQTNPLLDCVMRNLGKKTFLSLLDEGFSPKETDEDGDSAIHYAATSHNSDYLKILLNHGISANELNIKHDKAPLFSAIMAASDTNIDLLIENGANIHFVDNMGNSYLHHCAMTNQAKYVLMFLKMGVSPKLINKQNSTFQKYLYMTPNKLLSEERRKQIDDVKLWLVENEIKIENE